MADVTTVEQPILAVGEVDQHPVRVHAATEDDEVVRSAFSPSRSLSPDAQIVHALRLDSTISS